MVMATANCNNQHRKCDTFHDRSKTTTQQVSCLDCRKQVVCFASKWTQLPWDTITIHQWIQSEQCIKWITSLACVCDSECGETNLKLNKRCLISINTVRFRYTVIGGMHVAVLRFRCQTSVFWNTQLAIAERRLISLGVSRLIEAACFCMCVPHDSRPIFSPPECI